MNEKSHQTVSRKISIRNLRPVAFPAFVALTLGALMLSGCAGILIKTPPPAVRVNDTERLLLRVAPFDEVVTAELGRAGLDPARLAAELEAEVRYGLYRRGQEEARDSASAQVLIDLQVRHLQAGAGGSGAYAAFALYGTRPGAAKADSVVWTVHVPARDNVPPSFTERHLIRFAAGEILTRIQPPPKEREPAPPLHLMR